MMDSVTDMVIGQFAQNFSAKAAALQPAASAGAARMAPPQMDTQLNALAIVWQLIKDFFAGLFGRRKGGSAE